MAKNKLQALLKKSRVLILDGSSGAALQKRGMPKGVCPEKWALDNPSHLMKLQKEYIKAGSKMLYTFTLGGTRTKLEEFGFGNDTEAINAGLAKISRKAAGKKLLVAGDIGPTGHFPKPFGDMEFEDCVSIFKEQVRGLLKGGVDLFVIETMIDIQEARAALIACKELSKLPVMVSMTFDKDKRTLTGTDPVAALITLQALGADVVGVNCSTGPKEMVEVIETMRPYAKVPLMAKPNAGLPRLVDGNTVFDMKAPEFASYTKPLIKAGACLIGGCCGTTPEYIKLIKANSKLKTQNSKVKHKNISALSSERKAVFLGETNEITIVGERINPTGKKQLQEELKQGLTAEVRRFASEQTEKGALILDVNVGMPGIDEKETMKKVVSLLSSITDAPLCIDSSSPDVIEAALRIYPGRALINSISGEPEKLKKLLPVAAKYGAMFILLPLGAKGVPETAKERQIIARKVIIAAEKYGYTNKDIVIDGLVMTVSSNQDAAKETLKLINWASHYGFNSIVGLSNVSFGLPERGLVNSTFLELAERNGLTMAIANPSADLSLRSKDAENLLLGKDTGCKAWVAKYGGVQGPESRVQSGKQPGVRDSRPETIHSAVVNGNKEIIVGLIQEALNKGEKPKDIVDLILLPAIAQVGDLYDKKTYFLPQLISSAEAMKVGFAVLEPLLAQQGVGSRESGVVVLATVKGDIHDIGKNIVALMLKNYGFKVYDLGKDVDEFTIIRKAKETGASIIGLSALMTTTMVEMKTVIELAKKEGLNCKFMIGGAVITQAYAEEIGADGYSRDAYEAVKLAKKLSEKKQGV